jgi:F-box protein 21
MSTKILDLPDEVLQVIFSFLSPYQILSAQRVCKRFTSIATEQLLWRQYCLDTWKWWSRNHQLDEKLHNPGATDWRQLFIARQRTSDEVVAALLGLTESESNRYQRIQQILDHRLDGKGDLLRLFHDAKSHSHYLAIRFVD